MMDVLVRWHHEAWSSHSFAERQMDWTYNTIWHDQLPAGEFRCVRCVNTMASLTRPISGSYLYVRNFNPKDKCFESYPAITMATFLNFTLTNVRSFKGISKLGRIRRLELDFCTKLDSDEGLAELQESLEWLHICQAKKFMPRDELLGLKKLKVLCLNRCAPWDPLESTCRHASLSIL